VNGHNLTSQWTHNSSFGRRVQAIDWTGEDNQSQPKYSKKTNYTRTQTRNLAITGQTSTSYKRQECNYM